MWKSFLHHGNYGWIQKQQMANNCIIFLLKANHKNTGYLVNFFLKYFFSVEYCLKYLFVLNCVIAWEDQSFFIKVNLKVYLSEYGQRIIWKEQHYILNPVCRIF